MSFNLYTRQNLVSFFVVSALLVMVFCYQTCAEQFPAVSKAVDSFSQAICPSCDGVGRHYFSVEETGRALLDALNAHDRDTVTVMMVPQHKILRDFFCDGTNIGCDACQQPLLRATPGRPFADAKDLSFEWVGVDETSADPADRMIKGCRGKGKSQLKLVHFRIKTQKNDQSVVESIPAMILKEGNIFRLVKFGSDSTAPLAHGFVDSTPPPPPPPTLPPAPAPSPALIPQAAPDDVAAQLRAALASAPGRHYASLAEAANGFVAALNARNRDEVAHLMVADTDIRQGFVCGKDSKGADHGTCAPCAPLSERAAPALRFVDVKDLTYELAGVDQQVPDKLASMIKACWPLTEAELKMVYFHIKAARGPRYGVDSVPAVIMKTGDFYQLVQFGLDKTIPLASGYSDELHPPPPSPELAEQLKGTQKDVTWMAGQIMQYFQGHGRPPPADSKIEPYLPLVFHHAPVPDPWGNPFTYRLGWDRTHSQRDWYLVVSSNGPDGVPDTPDDIHSEKARL